VSVYQYARGRNSVFFCFAELLGVFLRRRPGEYQLGCCGPRYNLCSNEEALQSAQLPLERAKRTRAYNTRTLRDIARFCARI
jgi:hypothetical protein